MPTYCYSDGMEVFERLFPRGKAPDRITLGNGAVVDRCRQAEVAGMVTSVRGSENPTHHRRQRNPWPMEPCVASGVHPDQARELSDHLQVHGCPTEVTKDGEPIYTSASHRKKALKIRGMHDKDSFS